MAFKAAKLLIKWSTNKQTIEQLTMRQRWNKSDRQRISTRDTHTLVRIHTKGELSSSALTSTSLSLLSNSIIAFYELLVKYLNPSIRTNSTLLLPRMLCVVCVSRRTHTNTHRLHVFALCIAAPVFRNSLQLNSININRLTCTFHQYKEKTRKVIRFQSWRSNVNNCRCTWVFMYIFAWVHSTTTSFC